MEQLFTVNNKPLLKQVIDKLLEIKAGTETNIRFDMQQWHADNKCKTVCCIAGLTCHLMVSPTKLKLGYNYGSSAIELLQIKGRVFNDEWDNILFQEWVWPVHYKMIRRDSGTLTAAISYLQDLYNDAAHFDSE